MCGAEASCFWPCIPEGTALHQGKHHEVAAWLPPEAQCLCKSQAGHPTAAGAYWHQCFTGSGTPTAYVSADTLQPVQDLVREARSMQVSCLLWGLLRALRRSGGVFVHHMAKCYLPRCLLGTRCKRQWTVPEEIVHTLLLCGNSDRCNQGAGAAPGGARRSPSSSGARGQSDRAVLCHSQHLPDHGARRPCRGSRRFTTSIL